MRDVSLSATPIVTVIGTISAANLPAAAAAAARCWLCTPYSSWRSREMRVASRDGLGGLQHRPVDLGLVRDEPRVAPHVLVLLVLHAGDRLDAAGDDDVGFAGHDPLRREHNRLQPRRAEAVDRRAGDGDGTAGAQRDLARNVPAGRAFGQRAAHEHVLDLFRRELRARDRVRDGVAAQRRAMRHVERATPALGESGARGRYDHGIGHGRTPVPPSRLSMRQRDHPLNVCLRPRGARATAPASRRRIGARRRGELVHPAHRRCTGPACPRRASAHRDTAESRSPVR